MAFKYMPSVKRNIVLVKIWLTILGLSAIAVMAASMAIFYLFRDNTIQDIESADRMTLTNISTLLSNTIDTTANTIIETYKNPAVKKLIYDNSSEWNETMIATVNNTLSTLSTYPFLNSIYILRESDILYKASNKGIPEDQEAALHDLIRGGNPGQPIPWTFRSFSGETAHMLSIFIGEKTSRGEGYESAVIGNVDMDMIHKAIFPDALTKDQEIFVVNRNGTVILHNNMDDYFTDVSKKDYMKRMMESDEDSGHYTIKENGKKYNVGFIYSAKGNYYIVHKIEYGLSVAKLTDARNTTLLYCFLVLLFVLVASLYMSHRIYRPINTIFSNIRGLFADVPQVSSHTDELQAMANATAKIVEQMNNYDKHIENKAALELFDLSRSHVKPEEIDDILKRMKLRLRYGSDTAIIVLRISNFKPFEAHNTIQAIEYQLHSIGDIASRVLSGKATCHAYPINSEHAVLIVSDDETSVRDIDMKACLEEVSETIYRILGLEVAIGISSISHETSNMPNQYKEAYELTHYRLIFGKRAIIDPDLIRTEARSDELASCHAAVIDAVKRTSVSDFEQSLSRLFAVCERLTYDHTMNACTELAIAISKITRDIGSKNQEERELDYYDIYVSFEKFEDFSEIGNRFKALYHEATAKLSELNNTNVGGIVSKAIQYLANNYADPDLSANEMADKLSITPSYFSKIFKEYTNATFPEYIASIRLDKAKEMLLQYPNQEIVEIGSKVGYNNASYFTAAFKKKYGITPSKFRANSLHMEG